MSSGYIRQIQSSDGSPVTPPTSVNVSASGWVAFADDAAYEAVYGAGSQGKSYFNTTELLLRGHNGTAWVYYQNGINRLEDAATTGSNQDLDPTYHNLLVVTNASLSSIRSIEPAKTLILYLANQTGSDVTLINEDAGASAGKRLLLPDGASFTLEDGNTAHFVYDSGFDSGNGIWRYTNTAGAGGSGTGTGAKNYVLSPDTADFVTNTGTASAVTTTDTAALPENNTKTTGVLCTISGGTIGDKTRFDTNLVDLGDGGANGAPEMYYKTKSGYVDGAASIRWVNRQTSEVLYTQVINAGNGRISKGVADIALLAGNNIDPEIYWNVTDETNGLVVSGAGTLAETRLVGYGGVKDYDISSYLNLTTGGTIELATARLEKGISGKWIFDFRVVISGASSNTVHDFTIGGLKWSTTFQAGTASGLANGSFCQTSTASTDPAGVVVRYDSATTVVRVSGRFELEVKPTWADFDGSVMYGTEAQGQNILSVANNTATNSVTSGSPVIFNTASKDPFNIYDNSNGRMTIPVGGNGDYQVNATVTDTSTAGQRRIAIYKNGAQVKAGTLRTSEKASQISALVPDLVAGDYIQIYNTGGSSITLSNNATTSYFDISKFATKSSKATGFPFADQHPGEYGLVKRGDSELLLEGVSSSSRGGSSSGETQIINFNETPVTDTGSAFQLNSRTATTGFSVTILQRGEYSIHTSTRTSVANSDLAIGINSKGASDANGSGSDLTSIDTDSVNGQPILTKAIDASGANEGLNTSFTKILDIGDIIRIHCNNDPSSGVSKTRLRIEQNIKI